MTILSSCCVGTVSLGNRHILRSSHCPQVIRSELECQQGCFRDNNSPLAQTPGTIFHTTRIVQTYWADTAQHGAERAFLDLSLCLFYPSLILRIPRISQNVMKTGQREVFGYLKTAYYARRMWCFSKHVAHMQTKAG